MAQVFKKAVIVQNSSTIEQKLKWPAADSFFRDQNLHFEMQKFPQKHTHATLPTRLAKTADWIEIERETSARVLWRVDATKSQSGEMKT